MLPVNEGLCLVVLNFRACRFICNLFFFFCFILYGFSLSIFGKEADSLPAGLSVSDRSNSTLFFVKGWECTASRHFPEERALSEDVLHIHSRVWQECGSTGRADEEEPGIRRGGSGIWGNEACLTSFHRLRGRVCLVTEVPLLMLVNVRLLPEICVLFFVCVS